MTKSSYETYFAISFLTNIITLHYFGAACQYASFRSLITNKLNLLYSSRNISIIFCFRYRRRQCSVIKHFQVSMAFPVLQLTAIFAPWQELLGLNLLQGSRFFFFNLTSDRCKKVSEDPHLVQCFWFQTDQQTFEQDSNLQVNSSWKPSRNSSEEVRICHFWE